jgi:alcohol dehydrogenase class IV
MERGIIMNIFKKLYCRTFQTGMKILLPILPYREPKILTNNKAVADVFKQQKITTSLLVTDQGISKLGLYNNLIETLKNNNINVIVYDKTVPNPTTDNVENALQLYKSNNCQSIIAFGGGSAMDCAKATGACVVYPNKSLNKMKGILKVQRKLPLLIAVPTTAGTGSETTLAAVITDSKTRHKYAINSFPLIPHYALLDATLTLGLPKHITSTTGMDALTHAVEAYIGNSTTKQTRTYALEAVKLIFNNIQNVYDDGTNLKSRQAMLTAAYKAGAAFTKSYVGYVHAIAHSLGGKYNIPHGLANAIILPYVLKSYGNKINKKLWKLGVYAGIFDKNTSYPQGAQLFIKKIEELNSYMNIPNNIPEIKKEDIAELAQTAEHEANPLYPVPTLFTSSQLEKIYIQLIKN